MPSFVTNDRNRYKHCSTEQRFFQPFAEKKPIAQSVVKLNQSTDKFVEY